MLDTWLNVLSVVVIFTLHALIRLIAVMLAVRKHIEPESRRDDEKQ